MITEDCISFETAKLLKEKGFDEPCTYLWIFEKTNNPEVDDNGVYKCPLKRYTESDYWNNTSIELFKKEDEYWNNNIDFFACPTLQMAMKWLREVYGLFIRITEDMTGNVFEWSVYQKNYGCKASTYVEDSYEQACETAIKYCLENLI